MTWRELRGVVSCRAAGGGHSRMQLEHRHVWPDPARRDVAAWNAFLFRYRHGRHLNFLYHSVTKPENRGAKATTKSKLIHSFNAIASQHSHTVPIEDYYRNLSKFYKSKAAGETFVRKFANIKKSMLLQGAEHLALVKSARVSALRRCQNNDAIISVLESSSSKVRAAADITLTKAEEPADEAAEDKQDTLDAYMLQAN
ncbi:hypothetical protein BC940DRAFT_319051 [Gongronella butleri]|nr:hypothetical protein BC940DRAFT_319051 [Gongronella butleri]